MPDKIEIHNDSCKKNKVFFAALGIGIVFYLLFFTFILPDGHEMLRLASGFAIMDIFAFFDTLG